MMKFFFCLFLTPFIFYSNYIYMLQYLFVLLFIILMFMVSLNSFYSSISYSFGLDYYSFGLVLLSLIICSLMCISMIFSNYLYFYFLMNTLLLFCLFVVFMTMNFIHMYIFFEFVLFPLMVLILGWGYQPERLLSGLYLFFYTLFASLPFLVVILNLYNFNYTFFFDYYLLFSTLGDIFSYVFILLAFFVKMPMFMFHFWLPKAHVQAPVCGSMILAGLMLKIGGYGLIRVMNVYEYFYINFSFLWFSICLLGSVYVGLICFMQVDMKCLVAYSSVAHMGMCIMGFLTMSYSGLYGSYLLMLGHGFCSSAMFYMVNLFYVRSHSRSFFINKGILLYIPSCSMFWFVLCCFNMSCPPSLNFLSELFILMSMLMYWGNSFIYFIFISFFCACFSYYLYSFTHNSLYHNMYSFSTLLVSEYLCLFVHMFPLFGLVMIMFIFVY